MGFPGVGFQGASYFSAPNPEVGAVLTYYVREDHTTLKELRNEAEKKRQEAGEDVPYPTYEELKKEAREQEASLLFVIVDGEGEALRTLTAPIEAGVHRLVWDFRTSPVGPISLKAPGDPVPWLTPEVGYMVPPGEYRVTMYTRKGGELSQASTSRTFTCQPLHHADMAPADRAALDAFNAEVATLARAISAAEAHRAHLASRLPFLEQAILAVPGFDGDWLAELATISSRLDELGEELTGDPVLARYEGQGRTSLKDRTDLIISSLWTTTSAPTGTFQRAYAEARDGFGEVLEDLDGVAARIASLEDELEEAGAPYTPGRLPRWDRE
jgi:hypothetical protein